MTEPQKSSSSLPPLPPPPSWGLVLFWVAATSFATHLILCRFYTLGTTVPNTIDINPCNLWKYAYQFPPTGQYSVLNWLGQPLYAPALHFFTLMADLPPWLFFTTYIPLAALLALLAMTALLRELDIHPWAAIFGAVIYAWQGDIGSFILPAHFAYAVQPAYLAVTAWAVLRLLRTGRWLYVLLIGLGCGAMVQALPDRGGIASLLIAGFFLAGWLLPKKHSRLLLKFSAAVALALLLALSGLFSIFQNNVEGVKFAGATSERETYALVTQYCLPPDETLSLAIPGFYGWYTNSTSGPYWGRIGRWTGPNEGYSRLNLAISTIGTPGALFALLGFILILHADWIGGETLTPQQRYFGRILAGFAVLALILSWGDYTPIYDWLYQLPLMNRWRNPLKWLEITTFVLPILSAYGAQHVLASVPNDQSLRPKLRLFIQNYFKLMMLGTSLFFFNTYFLSYFASAWVQNKQGMEEFSESDLAHIISLMHFSAFLAAALTFACAAVIWAAWSPKNLRTLQVPNPWITYAWQFILKSNHIPLTLALVLSLLSVGQLAWVTYQFILPVSLHTRTDLNDFLLSLAQRNNQSRVKINAQDAVLDEFLQQQINSLPISTLDVSAASRMPQDLEAFFQAFTNAPSRLYNLCGVDEMAVPAFDVTKLQQDPYLKANMASIEGYSLLPNNSPDLPSHALIHLRSYLQKATFIPKAEVVANRAEALERLTDLDWNLHDTIVLEKDLLPLPAFLPSLVVPGAIFKPTYGQVTMKNYNGQRIDFSVKASGPGYILINDYYDKDWHATVNGKRVPLLRADYILRALAVPEGDSQVTLIYAQTYRLGSLSLLALFVNFFCDSLTVAGTALALWGLLARRKDHA